MPAIWIKLVMSQTDADTELFSMLLGSVALESWVRAQSLAWPLTPTTFWVGGFSTPGGRKAAWPHGKALSWSGWRWTAPSTWSNMTALIVCTESSSSKTAGFPTCRCWLRKSVSTRTTWRIGRFLARCFCSPLITVSYLASVYQSGSSETGFLLIGWVRGYLMITWF